MTAISKDEIAKGELVSKPIQFTLNGKTVTGRADETIIKTARKNGIVIPHLCHGKGTRPDGNCRACVVEIKGERVLAPSCCRYPVEGMEVNTESPRALASQVASEAFVPKPSSTSTAGLWAAISTANPACFTPRSALEGCTGPRLDWIAVASSLDSRRYSF